MILRKELPYRAIGKDGDYVGETKKSRQRRLREGWFDQYAPENLGGIDIGCGIDCLNQSFMRWDAIYGDGDATYMDNVPDNSFFTVYASHILEHLEDPIEAVRNWWRILKTGGHLIVVVPHRDLYERKQTLPSLWNSDHKWLWLPEISDPPHTLSLKEVVSTATKRNDFLIRVLDEGYRDRGVDKQPLGEYSIEVIIKK